MPLDPLLPGVVTTQVTTDSAHAHPVADNVLARRFEGWAPNRAWCADITYLATDEGWLYLACVLDLGTRRIVGWSMSSRLNAELACDALKLAYARWRPAAGLLVHSDRGVQGGFNRSLQHRAVRQISDSHSALRPVSSSPMSCAACCSGCLPRTESLVRSTETDLCLSGILALKVLN